MMNSIDIFDKEQIKDLLYSSLAHNQCPACLKVFGKGPMVADFEVPCSNCRYRGQEWRKFPNGSTVKLFAKIRDFFIDDEKEMVVVLFCTLFEVLMDNFFRNFCEARNVPYEIISFLQDEIKISSKVDKMFKRFVGVKFKEAIQNTKHRNFYTDWNKIKDKRNSFIHSDTYCISDDDGRLAWELTVHSFSLFACLNNDYCVRNTK